MKKLLLTTTLLAYHTLLLFGQNLVPNPGFENYTNCPTSFGQIACPLVATPPFSATVQDWISAVPNSPDYYNTCSGNIYASVPNNYFGNHPPHSGNAYTAIVAYSAGPNFSMPPSTYAEYVECKLTNPLIAGKTYEISCFVRLTFRIDPLHVTNIRGMESIGAVLSHFQTVSSTAPMGQPSIALKSISSQYIDNLNNWMEIRGEYTAVGGEEWLTIGVFSGTTVPSSIQVSPTTPAPFTAYHSYYLLDDVSVIEKPQCDTLAYSHTEVICNPNDFPLQLTSSDTGASQYTWSNAAITSSSFVNTSGIYWSNAFSGCNVVRDTFNISYLKDTIYSSKTITACSPDTTLSTRGNAIDYKWSNGRRTQNVNTDKFGTIWCSSIKDCNLYVDTIHLVQKSLINSIDIGKDFEVCEEKEVHIGSVYPHAIAYSWSNGSTDCCISPKESGTYVLNVSDACNVYTDSISVKISQCKNCFFIPTIFSPNADGINDTYGVHPKCDIQNFSLNIYNRWGERVFTSSDLSSRWQGQYNNQPAEAGVYHYLIQYNTIQQPYQKELLKGDITLIR